MAEQDALDQVLRDRAAVDGHERLRFAGALALDGAGDQLLADARFALDEDGDRRIGGAFAELDDPLHGLAAGDEVGEAEIAIGGGLHAGDLAGQRLDPKRVLDGDLEPLGAYRLHHEIDGAGAHGRDGGIDAAMGGLHDDGWLARQGPHGRQHRHAVRAGHDEVEKDEADFAGAISLERGKGAIAAVGGFDVVAEPLDGLFENTTLCRVVIDDQDALGHDAKLTSYANTNETEAPRSRRNTGPQRTPAVPKLCSGKVNIFFIAVRFW